MMNITIDLPDPGDGKVISLEVVRESRYGRKLFKKCTHDRVTVDTSLALLKCRDCKEQINPVEYIAQLAEDWHHVKRLYSDYTDARKRYEGKKRCRCEHCNKVTRVTPPSKAEVRAFDRARALTREAGGE